MSVFFRLKRYGKGVVSLLERILPESAFDRFYRFTFPKYKQLVRAGYRARSFRHVFSGDAEREDMSRRIYEVMPHTLVGIGGLEATYRMARLMNRRHVPGDFVELGVARGGCAALLAGVAFRERAPDRKLWLFDSYEGLPDPTEEDYNEKMTETGDHVRPLHKGSCLGTLDEVKDLLFRNFRFPDGRIEFVKGWFQDTLPLIKSRIGAIALLRLDGDWYASTKVCLEHLFDQVSAGGAVIIDDYYSCFGCKRAVDEFLLARGISVELIPDGRGGSYFLKP